jgi:hypothetical protein
MGYKRIEKTNNAQDVPEGKHLAQIASIGEKTIEVDEQAWDKSLGAKVKTGRKVPKTFMEWDFEITDIKNGAAPHVTDLYNISFYADPDTGMESKLYKSLTMLKALPELGEDFEPDDIVGRKVEVSVVHKEGWPRIRGPVVKAL